MKLRSILQNILFQYQNFVKSDIIWVLANHAAEIIPSKHCCKCDTRAQKLYLVIWFSFLYIYIYL